MYSHGLYILLYSTYICMYLPKGGDRQLFFHYTMHCFVTFVKKRCLQSCEIILWLIHASIILLYTITTELGVSSDL